MSTRFLRAAIVTIAGAIVLLLALSWLRDRTVSATKPDQPPGAQLRLAAKMGDEGSSAVQAPPRRAADERVALASKYGGPASSRPEVDELQEDQPSDAGLVHTDASQQVPPEDRFAILQDAFAKESRDDAWTQALGGQLQEAIDAESLELESLELQCRKSLCLGKLVLPSPAAARSLYELAPVQSDEFLLGGLKHDKDRVQVEVFFTRSGVKVDEVLLEHRAGL